MVGSPDLPVRDMRSFDRKHDSFQSILRADTLKKLMDSVLSMNRAAKREASVEVLRNCPLTAID
jgi:hypothetical protein